MSWKPNISAVTQVLTSATVDKVGNGGGVRQCSYASVDPYRDGSLGRESSQHVLGEFERTRGILYSSESALQVGRLWARAFSRERDRFPASLRSEGKRRV